MKCKVVLQHPKAGFGSSGPKIMALRLESWRVRPVAFAISALLVFASARIQGAPYRPSSDSEIVERVRRGPLDERTKELREARTAISQDPTNLASAVRLCRLYIEKGRSTSEPRYLGYAESALAAWWNVANAPPEVLVLRATIRQSRHEFDQALADLNAALTEDPQNAQAWLTRATILQVKGDYAAAKESCRPLLRLVSPLIAVTSLSTIRSLTGEAEAAYAALGKTLEQSGKHSVAERQWALTALAEIGARLGKDAEAERHFQQALKLGERDGYLLGAYADFLLDQQRPAEAEQLLENEMAVDALLLRLAIAEQRLGNSRAASDYAAQLNERFQASTRRGETVHQREEARYQLHLRKNAAGALKLALANWQVQREPWDARLLLESGAAVGDEKAVRIVSDWARANRLEDIQLGRLLDKAGLIRTAARP